MTFDEANNKWNSIVGNSKLSKNDIELLKKFFFKMGENNGVREVGIKTGLLKETNAAASK